MLKLKSLIIETYDASAAEELADRLNKEINAPYVKAYVSTLGGKERASVLCTVSLDKKEDWPNGILQNSRYAQFHIRNDGTIEQFSRSHKLGQKFRKTREQWPDEMVKKINIYLQKIGK